MIELTSNSFVKTLYEIITDSPSSVLFVVLGTVFAIAMIVNMRKNEKMGKSLFVFGWIFIILFILVKYTSFLGKIFDNLINTIFMQIFFPNLATYIIIIILTNLIFLYTINNKKIKYFVKIINTAFFIAIMVLMVYTLEEINAYEINIYSENDVYKNQNVLVLIESTTILFIIWTVIILSKLAINHLIKKSDNKLKQEYEEYESNNKNKNDNNKDENNNKNDDNKKDVEVLKL